MKRWPFLLPLLPLLALSAQAQSFNSRDPNQLYRQQLQPIDRQGFGYVNQLGGGVDDRGYYRRPIPSEDAFGQQLDEGWHEAPMGWNEGDQDSSVLYYVNQDGQIIQQDYRLHRGQ